MWSNKTSEENKAAARVGRAQVSLYWPGEVLRRASQRLRVRVAIPQAGGRGRGEGCVLGHLKLVRMQRRVIGPGTSRCEPCSPRHLAISGLTVSSQANNPCIGPDNGVQGQGTHLLPAFIWMVRGTGVSEVTEKVGGHPAGGIS